MIIQGRLTLVTQSEFKEQSRDKDYRLKLSRVDTVRFVIDVSLHIVVCKL